jgi:hypothetical protein
MKGGIAALFAFHFSKRMFAQGEGRSELPLLDWAKLRTGRGDIARTTQSSMVV